MNSSRVVIASAAKQSSDRGVAAALDCFVALLLAMTTPVQLNRIIIARLQAQARLIAAYEESQRPRRPPSTADLIRRLMDQHGLTRADMVPFLGTPSRVSEVLKKGLSMAMVQRLRARFRAPADFLIPPPKQARRSTKRAAA